MDGFHPGNVMPLTAPLGGVVAGTFYQIGQLLVRAVATAAAGARFEGVAVGVHHGVPKNAPEAWAEGALVYWDAAAGEFTTVDTGNFLAGCAAVAADAADIVGDVRLNGIAGGNQAT